MATLHESDEMRAEVQKAVDEVNSHVGPVEQIKRFAILDHDLSQETGELTPTLKVKRNVVKEKFAGVVDEVYGRRARAAPCRSAARTAAGRSAPTRRAATSMCWAAVCASRRRRPSGLVE